MSNLGKTVVNTKMFVTVYNQYYKIDFKKPKNNYELKFNSLKDMGIRAENCILNNLWKDFEIVEK